MVPHLARLVITDPFLRSIVARKVPDGTVVLTEMPKIDVEKVRTWATPIEVPKMERMAVYDAERERKYQGKLQRKSQRPVWRR